MSMADTEDAVGYLVKRVQQSLRRHCDAALKPTGLSMAQFAVLRALRDHPHASAATLARLCFVTRQSLQDVLAVLRDTGLVEPTGGPSAGRARALRLTAPGRQQLGRGAAVIDEVESLMVAGIPDAGREKLVALLTRCAENLESHAPA